MWRDVGETKNGKIDVGIKHQEFNGQDYAINDENTHLKLLQNISAVGDLVGKY